MSDKSVAVKPIDALRAQFNMPAMREQLKAALPPHVSVDKFERVSLSLLQNQPALLECDRTSLFSAIMTVAQLGLMPDSVLGEVYLSVYKGKVTVIIGYRGQMKLARQSGEVRTIYAELIHERDEFQYVAGTERKLIHKPMWGADPGALIGAYAVAELNDGFVQFVVMSIEEIERIRKASFTGESPAWKGIGYPEMVKKTALRRLMKGLPMSVDPAALRDDGDDSLVSTQGPTTGSSGSVAQLDKPRARAPRLQQLADQVESSPSGDEPFPGEAANDGVIGFGDGGDSAI